MDTLVKNATLRFSRRADDYEPLNPTGQLLGRRRRDGNDGGRVSFSGPKSYRDHPDHVGQGLRKISRPKSYRNQETMMKSSFSYRRDRARKRHIFLQSYKLASMESGSKSKRKKLKRVVLKFKSFVVSVLSVIRADSLGSCKSRSAISASLPTSVVKCC